MAKSTSAEIDDRLTVVMNLIAEEKTRSEILQYCSKKWNISDRQVDEYVSRARKIRNDEYIEKYRESIVYKSVKRLEDLYQKNYENEDYTECRNIVLKQNELLGTITKKIENTKTRIIVSPKYAAD
jgi:hypothetical protein